ncbi:calcineurin-like phosphoesterase [Aureococcus anophagefferens]|nr:calcineurin-like phosphoesterase [Aureococcus anophagefferens]
MRLAAEATQDRSFHREGGCAAAARAAATGAGAIVAGHTPGDDVRELCGGAVLAADSSPRGRSGRTAPLLRRRQPQTRRLLRHAEALRGSVATLTRASADDPGRATLRVAIDGGRTRAADDDDAPADGLPRASRRRRRRPRVLVARRGPGEAAAPR